MLSKALVGTWSLVSRETRTTRGDIVAPGSLGDDPIALLIYDQYGNFAAQFMRRGRDEVSSDQPNAPASVRNNTGAIGGYDAYFGRYTVDDARGTVTQTLVGSLSPANVGQVLTREMSVTGDDLCIRVDVSTADGDDAVITLKWRRATADSSP